MLDNTELLKSYDTLLEKAKEMTILGSTGSIIQWDMETKMPPKALELRSLQLAQLELIGHKMLTDPQIGKLLDQIEANNNYQKMTQVQRRNIYLSRKAYDEATKLPEELVFETAKQRTIAVGVWKKAKAAKDYRIFKPELEKMIELRKRAADILMKVKGVNAPYDALLDSFESRMTSKQITEIFNEMRDGLIEIIKKINKSKNKPDESILTRPVSVEIQRKISEAAMQFIDYDTSSSTAGGRLDETEHPFTTGYYDDVRITTHYHENRWASSLYSVLHEGGHALYEQNLPRNYMYQPIGQNASYGIHESQSRFIENMVGKSPEFLSYMLPKIKVIVGKPLRGVKIRDFIASINFVKPSKIRIEADEATYGLHIIIRFEIEREIFANKLSVDDLPDVWNKKYKEYLGVKIENDSEGVMQDTHWASGYFGYFPSYALGNIYGGMFLDKLRREVPDWLKKIKEGDFLPTKKWLIENIHDKGNLLDPADLIKEVTRKKISVKPFLGYLEKKYNRIYKF